MRKVNLVLMVLVILAGCASQEMTSGKIHMQQENWDKAIEFFTAEVEKNPDNPDAYMWLARAYTQKKQYEIAADNFNKATRIDPNIVQPWEKPFLWSIYNAAGEQAVNRDDYISAISYFNNSVELEPDSAITYTYLAYAYSKMGDTANTIKSYQTAIEKEPSNSELRFKLAQYYMGIKKYEEAIQEFKEAAELDLLTHTHAFYYMRACYTSLGSIYLQGKKYQKAVDAYTEAIELSPEDPILYYNRASAYLGLGMTSEQQADEAKVKELGEEPYVEYQVTGSATTVDVTYTNKDGGTSQENGVFVPWGCSFKGRYGMFVYISAQNQGESGRVTVTIYKNYEVFKTSTSSGAYCIAEASGTL